MNQYERGYSTGKKWDKPWAPGGPWFDRNCQKSIDENKAWKKGFNDGYEKQQEIKNES